MAVEKKVIRCIKIDELYDCTDTELISIQIKISEILGERRDGLRKEYQEKMELLLKEMLDSGFFISPTCYGLGYQVTDLYDEDKECD